MKRSDEPNPALGWRAIRVGLDRPGMMRMQVQALIRAAKGRPLTIMFPFVTECREFEAGKALILSEVDREHERGHAVPRVLKIGAMLETPSLAYASDRFFGLTDFISVGGNDLKQFFFAADRENEWVRRRYDMLSLSFLTFLEHIVMRCAATGTPLSFCGEDAGRPIEALGLAAMGFRSLSMRPASIGPVKALLRQVDLGLVREAIEDARAAGDPSARPAIEAVLSEQGIVHCPHGGGPAAVALALAEGAPHSRGTRTGGRMLNALTLLFLCQLVGEAAVSLLGITFPGPVLGMALLFAGLLVVGRSGEALDGVADTILRNLSLLFVPAAVGVMQQAGLIAANWVAIFAALALSTVATLVVTVYAFLAVSRLVARRRA